MSGGDWLEGLIREAHEYKTYPPREKQRMKIYVASSWRNRLYPGIVQALKSMGHDPYDFRNPVPGNHGFNWRQVDPDYSGGPVGVDRWRKFLAHPVAEQGYRFDIEAVRSCELVILVLPAGRSACYEFGYAMGQGKRGIVLALDDEQPDLMFKEATLCGSMDEFFDAMNFHG